MFKLKEKTSDFIVEEKIKLKFSDNGKYSYFLLEKDNRNTLDVINRIVDVLKITKRDIGYAGLKDKNAITRQYISIFNYDKKLILNLKIDGVKLNYVGNGKIPITIGSLEGNNFKVVVRNLDKKAEKINFLENYYDEQRFSKDNVSLGKQILLGKILYEKEEKLKLYFISYQAYLFNKILAEYLKEHCKDQKEVDYSLGKFIFIYKEVKNFKIPLIAFDARLNDNIRKICSKILNEEGLTIKHFLTRKYPDLVQKTIYRDALVNVKNLKIKYREDDVYSGKLKAEIEFFLPKGSYGTLLIRKMFS